MVSIFDVVDVPPNILALIFCGAFAMSLYFFYKFYKKKTLTHLTFGMMILCWSAVIVLSIVTSEPGPLSDLYFRLYATFAILSYMFLVYFARAFTKLKILDTRTIAVAIPTLFIIALVWVAPIQVDDAGSDFSFESFFGDPSGLPFLEVISLFLWSTTLVFLVRMFLYSRNLWKESKGLGMKTLLLGVAGAGTFLIYAVEVVTLFYIDRYTVWIYVMAAMAAMAFVVPGSWFDKVLGK
jgi:hypothetical protein